MSDVKLKRIEILNRNKAICDLKCHLSVDKIESVNHLNLEFLHFWP